MKILALDHYGGDGMLDLVCRWQDDGHSVRWFFKKDERNANIGKGLAETRVADWREHVRWADLIVCADNTIYLHELDRIRKADPKKRVVGATVDAAAWELDRNLGQAVFKRAGIAVPPYREFSTYDAAIAHVKATGEAYACKPSYDEPDKSLSYVAKSPADLVYMLETWKKARRHKGPFILQEKIAGCEMAVGGFFGPAGFLKGWCENWEFKTLCPGDKGPNCGEMGTVLRFTAKSKLADRVLKPLESRLARLRYVGYVDVNCIIDDAGEPWPLEFTMRFGWPTFNIQQALLTGDSAEWLADLADGKNTPSGSRPFALERVATGVVLALPEFPYNKTPIDKVTGVPVYGALERRLRKHIHPCQMMRSESVPTDVNDSVVNLPCLQTAGDYVLLATGTGETIRQARGRAYKVLDGLRVPASPFWRPDIGERLKEQLPMIQTKGYASNLNF